jgi:pumilio homology domain family member 6
MAIAKELQGRYVELAKAKYGKFLVGKILEYGFVPSVDCADMRNADIRNLVVKEYMGNVTKLISHKEAGMIVNDVYRDICTPGQRLEFLQELYGPEFRLFKVMNLLGLTKSRAKKNCRYMRFLNRNQRRKK